MKAIAHRDIAKPARAGRAGHRGIADQCDGGDRQTADQGGQRLREHHAQDDLTIGRAHTLGRLHNAIVNFRQRAFHQARNKRRGCDGQRHAGGGCTDDLAHDQPCKRKERHHQDNKRQRTQDVDDPAENGIEYTVFHNAAAVGHAQQHTHRQAEYVGADG